VCRRVGKDTVRKVETILQKGTEEQIRKLEQAKTTFNSIAKQIHDAEKRQELKLLNNNNNINIKLIYGDFTSILEKQIKAEDHRLPVLLLQYGIT
jgi:hypothetical protein